jgi:hypothetical protein
MISVPAVRLIRSAPDENIDPGLPVRHSDGEDFFIRSRGKKYPIVRTVRGLEDDPGQLISEGIGVQRQNLVPQMLAASSNIAERSVRPALDEVGTSAGVRIQVDRIPTASGSALHLNVPVEAFIEGFETQ